MVVDANVWISAFVRTDVNHNPSEQWRQAWLRSRRELVLPTLVLAEVGGAMSRRVGSPFVANGLVASLSTDPEIELRALDRELGEKAARIAVRHGLRGADAVYAALAAELDAPLVTWDQEILIRAAGIIDVRTPGQISV